MLLFGVINALSRRRGPDTIFVDIPKEWEMPVRADRGD
jgi:hypothetical protein